MKKVILYIHGFNSGPGDKSIELQKQFPDCEIISPQLPYDCDEAMKILREIVDNNLDNEVYVVATSLGAFYAMMLSVLQVFEDNISFYLINPSLIPHTTLSRFINTTVVNYKTGESFYVSKDFLNKLEAYHKALVQTYSLSALHSCNFFLGTLDELLDFTTLLDFIKQYKAPYKVYYSQQDHRFADISLVVSEIRKNMVY